MRATQADVLQARVAMRELVPAHVEHLAPPPEVHWYADGVLQREDETLYLVWTVMLRPPGVLPDDHSSLPFFTVRADVEKSIAGMPARQIVTMLQAELEDVFREHGIPALYSDAVASLRVTASAPLPAA